MAKQAIFSGQLTTETMNSGDSYRVRFSYGTFSAAPKVTQGITYYYLVKRARGHLFKVYLGKCGEITRKLLHQAALELLNKVAAATGRQYLKDNRGRS